MFCPSHWDKTPFWTEQNAHLFLVSFSDLINIFLENTVSFSQKEFFCSILITVFSGDSAECIHSCTLLAPSPSIRHLSNSKRRTILLPKKSNPVRSDIFFFFFMKTFLGGRGWGRSRFPHTILHLPLYNATRPKIGIL